MPYAVETAMGQYAIARGGTVDSAFFGSAAYRIAVQQDLAQTPRIDDDDFFTKHQVPQAALSHGAYQAVIAMWEQILGVIRSIDHLRYDAMHKGTPFYWLGVASYLLEDYRRAVFYIDSGVAEDARNARPPVRWEDLPAGLFLRLDTTNPRQAAFPLVQRARATCTSTLGKVAAAGGATIAVDDLVGKLITPAVAGSPELRSAVSALHTYILEYDTRRRQLELSSFHDSSGEPVFVHLFTGGVLFETLLRCSVDGAAVTSAVGGGAPTLNSFLTNPTIRTKLGLPSSFGGMGPGTFADVLSRSRAAASTKSFSDRAVWTLWGLRNTVGHSLAWTPKPTVADHEELFLLTLGAIALAVERLF